ncbi:uncharacterized protein LOC108907749 [Anoplophora glabripennis]|uniref:uncharacterized protein LOC108907749 n=1 Tax=Anoplophora glabripennis TaxID=217634 RepID=UPI000874A48B|nr:uncharacterized protein LOC108907749 [Anoplophora glabripennis]
MGHSALFTNGRLWILLVLCLCACADVKNDKCRRPEILSPRTLFVYQQTDTVDVTIYHCHYRQEIKCIHGNCSDCLVNKLKYTDVETTYQYSDITQNCINAFDTNKFIDKYGISNQPKVVTYNLNCTYSRLDKIVNVTLRKYDRRAEIGRDRIVLQSGTFCKYTSGFCHDKKEDIDVMWTVKDLADECSLYRKINVSDLYYFAFNHNRYAILESYGKYFPIKLTTKQGSCSVAKTWKTQQEGLIITEGLIVNASSNNILQPTDYLKFYFTNKQALYDFLTETCTADLNNENSNSWLLQKSFSTKSKLRDQDNSLNNLNTEIQSLLSKAKIYFYIIVFIVLCLTSVIVLLTYFILKTKSSIINCSYPRYPPPNPSGPVNIVNAYEYITSEYDINSIYEKKYCQLPEKISKTSNARSMYESTLEH